MPSIIQYQKYLLINAEVLSELLLGNIKSTEKLCRTFYMHPH